MRYRRSVKLGPGLRLNASKRGMSLTFGPRGYHHTISTSGRRTTTVGVPGTGLYWQESQSARRPSERSVPATRQAGRAVTHSGLFAPAYEKEFARALEELIAGRNEQALEHLERSVGKDSDQRSVADDLLAGTVCVILGRLPDAIPHLERVVTAQVELPDALMRHYLPDGLLVELKIGDRVHITLMLGSVAAALMLATAYETAERYDEAIGLLQQLVDAHPEPASKLLLCLLLAHEQEWQDIVTVAAGAGTADDIGLALSLLSAEALCELGLPDGALQTLSTALRSSSREPELRKQARYLRATAYQQQGQHARARKELEQLYALDPAYRDVAALLGLAPNPAPAHDLALSAPAGAPAAGDEVPAKTYRFEVSAPAPETLAWLRSRAERSGLGIASDSAAAFSVTWKGAVIREDAAPANLDFDVVPEKARRAQVSVTVTARGVPHLDVLRDFAGPLADRMSAPEQVPPAT